MGGVPIEEVLQLINQRLERLESKVDDIDRRVARLEAKMDDVSSEVQQLRRVLNAARNATWKWILALIGMILSFVAALFGLGWRPP